MKLQFAVLNLGKAHIYRILFMENDGKYDYLSFNHIAALKECSKASPQKSTSKTTDDVDT